MYKANKIHKIIRNLQGNLIFRTQSVNEYFKAGKRSGRAIKGNKILFIANSQKIESLTNAVSAFLVAAQGKQNPYSSHVKSKKWKIA